MEQQHADHRGYREKEDEYVTDDERNTARVVAPPPPIYLGPLVLRLLPTRKSGFLSCRAGRRALRWLLLVRRVSLVSQFFFTMRRADTPIDPREPASNLATNGPFRHTRNPAHLSVAMIYAGISSPANALSPILPTAVLLVIQRSVIEREVLCLERTFREESLWYKARVRRRA